MAEGGNGGAEEKGLGTAAIIVVLSAETNNAEWGNGG